MVSGEVRRLVKDFDAKRARGELTQEHITRKGGLTASFSFLGVFWLDLRPTRYD